MGDSKTVSKAVFFLVLIALSFEQGCSATTAKLFPNRAQAWTKIPTVVVSGKDGDPRNQLVFDAVDFWNQQLSEIGSAFRLGPVTFTNEIIPDEELERRSNAVLNGQEFEPTSSLMKIHGDLIVALSDWDLVSFAGPALRDGRRIVGIRGYQHSPLTVPNVARNVIAHELGHAIGLGHNNDPAYLMCGRPASCRPNAFRSGIQRYFPLLADERQTLLKLYPPTWKPVE